MYKNKQNIDAKYTFFFLAVTLYLLTIKEIQFKASFDCDTNVNQKLSYKFRPLLLAGALSALFFTGSAIASVNTNDTPIYVKPVSNLPQDFILGMDVSSYVAQKNSGVKYYDFKGNELDDLGFFKQLKDCGTTHIRIRALLLHFKK